MIRITTIMVVHSLTYNLLTLRRKEIYLPMAGVVMKHNKLETFRKKFGVVETSWRTQD